MAQLSFRDETGATVPFEFVDTDAVVALSAATSGSPSVPFLTSGPASLAFPDGTLIDGAAVIFTDLFALTFTDPNGCQPVVGLTLTSNGTRSKHTGCFPGLHDMKKSGTITSDVGFTATAAATASFGLELTPISSTNCVSIDAPTALVLAATAVANLPLSIPLTISPPPGGGGSGSSGGSSCPSQSAGCLQSSTLSCTPLGSNGVASTCTPASVFQQLGIPMPCQCAPQGTTGCFNVNNLVNPCCDNLTCRVSSACGGGSVGGGVCLP